MKLRSVVFTVPVLVALTVNAQTTDRPKPPALFERGRFIPSGGYKHTVDVLRFEREAQASSARAAVLRIRPTALTGKRTLPVVLVSFKNRPAAFAQPRYTNLIFSTAAVSGTPAKTVSQYYRDVSAGRFDVQGTVTDWYTLAKDDTYYENNEVDANGQIIGLSNGSGVPLGKLLEEALSHADQDIDFADYDNDGPDERPNSGDDDGKVDTVLIIHSEAGGECQNLDLENIWSHSWHYSDPTYGHKGAFQTRAIRKDRAGKPVIKNGLPERIVIDDYTIQPGLACHRKDEPERIVDIGVICHEYGHALGLPDLYDRTPPASPDSSGVGNYCLMAGGSYGANGEQADLPAFMSAWARAYLGWTSPRPIQPGELAFEPAVLQGRAYEFDVAGTKGREYFLVEWA